MTKLPRISGRECSAALYPDSSDPPGSRAPRCLLAQFRRDVEAALREGRIGYEESGRLLRSYEDSLHGCTYLEEAHAR